jgi:hypothetical protein
VEIAAQAAAVMTAAMAMRAVQVQGGTRRLAEVGGGGSDLVQLGLRANGPHLADGVAGEGFCVC